MNQKFLSIPSAAVIPFGAAFVTVFSLMMAVESLQAGDTMIGLFFLGCMILMDLLFLVLFAGAACPVELLETKLVCRRLFRPEIEIDYHKCRVGMDYHIQNGQKIWWIYLCYGEMPPYKSSLPGNRINSIQCQPGFVRIMYREKVFDALMEVLPKEKKTMLCDARSGSGFQKQGSMFF